jgi:hypothetical protein
MVDGGFIIQPMFPTGADLEQADSLVIHMLELMPYGWLPSNSFAAQSMFHQILMATGALREATEQVRRDHIGNVQ